MPLLAVLDIFVGYCVIVFLLLCCGVIVAEELVDCAVQDLRHNVCHKVFAGFARGLL